MDKLLGLATTSSELDAAGVRQPICACSLEKQNCPRALQLVMGVGFTYKAKVLMMVRDQLHGGKKRKTVQKDASEVIKGNKTGSRNKARLPTYKQHRLTSMCTNPGLTSGDGEDPAQHGFFRAVLQNVVIQT